MMSAVLKFFRRRKKSVDIYTDGSAKDGIGAWAYVVVRDGHAVCEKAGAVKKTSSNPMEFRAAIEALKGLSEKTTATLYSDSRILVDTMTVWRNTDLRPRGLAVEIALLDELVAAHEITWKWIRAHAGHEFNERCDHLCLQARRAPWHSGCSP